MKALLATLAVAGTLTTAQAKPGTDIAINGDRAPVVAQGAVSERGGSIIRERRKTHQRAGKRGYGLGGVVAPLAAKAREIVAACGSRVISAVRHTYIRGTGGRLSLHASGRAIDMQGNPACMYAALRGWPGGVSIDYGRVQHVHFSYAPGGPEWGSRFRHGGRRARR